MAESHGRTRASRLKEARIQAGLTQAEAAKRLGVGVSTWKSWESEQGGSPRTVEDKLRLCQLLDISLEWYLSGEGPMMRRDMGRTLTVWQERLLQEVEGLDEDDLRALIAIMRRLRSQGPG